MKNALKKIRKFATMPVFTAVLLIAALLLLGTGSVNGARAALTYYSDDYNTRMAMKNIGVTILEDGSRLSWRDYSSKQDGSWDENMGTLSMSVADPDGTIKIGKKYDANLSVKNTGEIDEYVRVIVTRYWADENGKRFQELSPDLIILDGLGAGDGWIIDENASTDERTVLYYTKPIAVGGSTTAFLKSVTADKSLENMVVEKRETNGKYTTITTSFKYDGVRIGLEIEADAVQTHSPEDAIWSAWGRRVRINSNGTLSLR